MKANYGKCYLFVKVNRPATILCKHTISNSSCEKLLGVKINFKWNVINEYLIQSSVKGALEAIFDN